MRSRSERAGRARAAFGAGRTGCGSREEVSRKWKVSQIKPVNVVTGTATTCPLSFITEMAIPPSASKKPMSVNSKTKRSL